MLESIWHLLALAATTLSVGGLFWWAVKTARKVREGFTMAVKAYRDLDEKVTTLWDNHMMRGYAEAVSKGAAVEEDVSTHQRLPPLDERRLVVSEDLRRRFKVKREGKELTVAQELRQAYRTKHLTRLQLEMWVSREFRDWLLDNVCIPLGIFEAGCIAIAMAIAKEE